MKRLLLTCTDLMGIQFLVPHVCYLSQHGFSVELACSQVGGRLEELRDVLEGVALVHEVRLVRNPFSAANRHGYGDLKKIIDSEPWDLVWTNEPVMGVMTRLAAREARKKGMKVVYMVHGFHFYDGAPKVNWMLYYPVEKYCSRLCDMIVTIHEEDRRRAETFHAARVEMIPGIGVKTQRFRECEIDRAQKRRELDVPEDAFFILSVGELKDHKNHEVVIRAIAKAHSDAICYGICGQGELREPLQKLAGELGVERQVRFFGYRRDIPEILHAADLFAFPSKREGLPMAGLEAMAAGLPLLTSNVRGVSDYTIDGKTGYRCDPTDVDAFAQGIQRYMENEVHRQEIGQYNQKFVGKYDLDNSRARVLEIFTTLF